MISNLIWFWQFTFIVSKKIASSTSWSVHRKSADFKEASKLNLGTSVVEERDLLWISIKIVSGGKKNTDWSRLTITRQEKKKNKKHDFSVIRIVDVQGCRRVRELSMSWRIVSRSRDVITETSTFALKEKKMDWSRWRIILDLIDQGTKWSATELPLVSELSRFGSDENDTDDEERSDNSEHRLLELFAYPGSRSALQRHVREE